MRILFCGDRYWDDEDIIQNIIAGLTLGGPQNFNDVIVHGAAPGADFIAGEIAGKLGYKVEKHPADWNMYRKAAGPIRNTEMVKSGIDLAFAFHDNLEESKGTKDMVKKLKKAGVRTYLISHQ